MTDNELVDKATNAWNQWLKSSIEIEHLYVEYGLPLPEIPEDNRMVPY
jgi:hypothetical protein